MTFDFADLGDAMHLPISSPGMRIGLFGGSFNPPHDGHRLVSRQALTRLKLDAVWWLVSPGNPLKSHRDLKPLSERIALARTMIDHPRVRITGFEAKYGFTYSYQTLEHLTRVLPDRHFVWIMGADNLRDFHHWERWREIASMLPIAVYVRPGSTRTAPFSPAAVSLSRYRIDESDAAALPGAPAPAWTLLHGIMSTLSSTALRNAAAQQP